MRGFRWSVRLTALTVPVWVGAHPARAQDAPPPAPGERVRIELASGVPGPLGPGVAFEGMFVTVRGLDLVVSAPRFGAVGVPLIGVRELRAYRERSPSYAWVRGGIAGGVFGLGMWQFLRILCRSACDSGFGSAWLPAAGTGLVVGLLVVNHGPGQAWVRAAVPEPRLGRGRPTFPRRPRQAVPRTPRSPAPPPRPGRGRGAR